MEKIKRYANRKLYHVTNKKYVNLSDLLAFIRQGREVEITLHTTGQDVTKEVLWSAITTLESLNSIEMHQLESLVRKGGIFKAAGLFEG